MGTQLVIKGKEKDPFDLPRGATVPREGDSLRLILKGETKESLYTVYLIEHAFDLNSRLAIGQTTITLEKVKAQKKGD
jgi:hypothetical protein